MEEKKKRVRPTWSQVRILEKELAEVKENYRLQLVADKYLAEEADELRLKLSQRQAEEHPSDCASLKFALDEQIEGTSRLVAECNAWREKYRVLFKKYNEQLEGTSRLVKDCDAWREKYNELVGKCAAIEESKANLQDSVSALEKSNKLMEDELSRVKQQRDQLASTCAAREMDIRNLRSRGFLKRVFNVR